MWFISSRDAKNMHWGLKTDKIRRVEIDAIKMVQIEESETNFSQMKRVYKAALCIKAAKSWVFVVVQEPNRKFHSSRSLT